MEERRKHKRFERIIGFRTSKTGVQENETINIGLGGFCARIGDYFESGESISVEIVLSNCTSIFCEGRIIWVYPETIQSPDREIGVEIIDIEKPHRQKLLQELYNKHY